MARLDVKQETVEAVPALTEEQKNAQGRKKESTKVTRGAGWDRYVPRKRIKKRHRKTGRGKSLRHFAIELLKAGDEDAKRWLKNKSAS